MYTSIAECIKAIESQEQVIKDSTDDFEESIKHEKAFLFDLQRQKQLLIGNLDMEKINKAESILDVYMFEDLQGDDLMCIEDVISELAVHNGASLFAHRNCTKNYSGYIHQYCGHVDYYMTPKHGHVVFSIGLKQSFRNEHKELSQGQIDACIYLLEMLKIGRWTTLKHFTRANT